MSALGMDEKSKKHAARRMGEEAERAGYGVREKKKTGSHEQMGSDLATTADPPTGECCGKGRNTQGRLGIT